MGVLFPLFALLLNPIMAAAAMAMSSVSVVTNSLRLRNFAPPKSAEEIIHPPLRQRIADVGYLAGIGLLALIIGAASLFVFRPAMGAANDMQMTGNVSAEQNARVSLSTGGTVSPGKEATIHLSVTDAQSGQLADAAVSHEAPMHLIVVSRDLSYFAHIHPQPTGSVGQYEIKHTFPAAGDYILYDEFGLAGKSDEVHRFDLRVGNSASAPANLVADLGPKTLDGYNVSIKLANDVMSGVESSFVVTVAQSGQPVTDLEPYLGAAAHVVVLDASAGGFAHVHAASGDMPAAQAGSTDEMAAPPASFGPDLSFSYTFEKPGLYKVWVQFARAGQVTTVPWVVEVR
jgi:Cu+-exporting ATPase